MDNNTYGGNNNVAATLDPFAQPVVALQPQTNVQPTASAQPVFGPQSAVNQPAANQATINQAASQPSQPAQTISPQASYTGTSPLKGQPTTPAKDNRPLIQTVIAVISSLVAATFVGLFIYMYFQWSDAKTDVTGQINSAVAVAVSDKTAELEAEFAKQQNYPYSSFAGPADYGELYFEYPRTWSQYEAQDASNGGNYEAYFNPEKVLPINGTNINAFRVSIKNQAFDSVVQTYDGNVQGGLMSVQVRPVGGANANIYTGTLPSNGQLQGIVAVFRIRDKTVELWTESMIFAEEFYQILDTVAYNQ